MLCNSQSRSHLMPMKVCSLSMCCIWIRKEASSSFSLFSGWECSAMTFLPVSLIGTLSEKKNLYSRQYISRAPHRLGDPVFESSVLGCSQHPDKYASFPLFWFSFFENSVSVLLPVSSSERNVVSIPVACQTNRLCRSGLHFPPMDCSCQDFWQIPTHSTVLAEDLGSGSCLFGFGEAPYLLPQVDEIHPEGRARLQCFFTGICQKLRHQELSSTLMPRPPVNEAHIWRTGPAWTQTFIRRCVIDWIV